ncbi:M13 family metallopeptidase [Flavobacterium alkalisoli]|uniref:M13 family metallopeptidase n=1 Tax=Flavobacterium alkalisoli TaxID=2602769 RepID=A0A5B9FN12_9FLAO|nr:M13 family metallopeptidase [Flavobacterium alkalisoli]QEE48663.1 M13 family metallopeptidase [Flavobacterium alkalisoli]
MKLDKNFKIAAAALVLGTGICSAQKQETHGINLSYMDKKVSPADDFFRYVNGTWIDQTEIPGNKTRWGSFDELRENTNNDALQILKEAAANRNYTADTDAGKAGRLYRSIMDTVARNKSGIAPIQPYLRRIDQVKDVHGLQQLLSDMEPEGGLGFFNLGVGADAKDSNKNVLYIGPGALGLPDRDYYVSDDDDSKEKKEKYEQHVARMLKYIDYSDKDAKDAAKRIVALETAMAEPRLDRVERRDDRKTYNPMAVNDLRGLTPIVDWKKFLNDTGIGNIDTLVVSQPRYMKALQAILAKGDVKTWKDYLKWTLINKSSGYLTTDIETADWEFYNKTLRGALKEESRDKNALQTVNGTIGEALGKLYVEKKFPAEAKVKAESMIKNVILAYENRINNLPWMAKSTKQNAIDKLRRLRVKIGYPDKWKDYSQLTVKGPEEGGTYFANMKAIARWRFNQDKEDLKKPVNKDEWHMAPQIVNAYFNPAYNEIVFPAGILQPPFYDYKADEAVNYGGIGAVIGHEISHGFDDSGSRYNADGNLVNWWSDTDLDQFTGLGGALADQYSKLQPLPGIYVDGKFTLGENIGDLGGVNAAFDGLQLYLKEHGNPGLIDGYTPEQRFFISWATIWRTKMRDEAIKNQVKTDPHSPGMYRAYVPLQNIDAFYKAFNIKEGNGMYLAPDDRVKIW